MSQIKAAATAFLASLEFSVLENIVAMHGKVPISPEFAKSVEAKLGKKWLDKHCVIYDPPPIEINDIKVEHPDEEAIKHAIHQAVCNIEGKWWHEKLDAIMDAIRPYVRKQEREAGGRISASQIATIKESLSNCEPEESGWLAENHYLEKGFDEGHTALLKSKWAAHNESEKKIENALRVIGDIEDGANK